MKRTCGRLALVLLCCGGTASAQSLADVARRAEAERAKAAADKKEPTKVITNDDLKKDPAAPEAPAAPGDTAKPVDKSKPAESKPAAKKGEAEPTHSESYWRRRATELHGRLAADEKSAAAGREKVERLRHIIDALGCVVCKERNQLESQIIRMEEEQTKLDAKVASDRSAIQDFEEEGRRAGILPGWLRP